MVPLLLMVVVWLANGEPFLIVRRPETGQLRLELTNVRAIVSVLVCAAIGCDFPYYPVFALWFVLVAGIYRFARSRSAGTLWQTATLAGVVASSFLANMSPSFLYWWREGPNLSPAHVAKRPWTDAEQLSLTVTQLLLPPLQHRIPCFRALRDRFYNGTHLVSEGDALALGIVGSLGFLLLMGCFVWGHGARSERGRLCHVLGVLTVCAVLVCTAGGFGTAFNLLGFGLVRCYNRISIFIGFLALAASCVGIDLLYRRYAEHRSGRVIAREASLPCSGSDWPIKPTSLTSPLSLTSRKPTKTTATSSHVSKRPSPRAPWCSRCLTSPFSLTPTPCTSYSRTIISVRTSIRISCAGASAPCMAGLPTTCMPT